MKKPIDMMKKIGGTLLLAAVGFALAPTPAAHAQECVAAKPAAELEGADIEAVYDCLKEVLLQGYQAGDNEVATQYRSWGAASTRPAAPGPHGDRFLMTFVNPVGYDEYVKFAEEGVSMPVGTVIAKESFKVGEAGKVQRGPLFIMTKAEAGTAPEAADWVYSGVQPNGAAMNFKQAFCSDCHRGLFEAQDSLGYPEEDVRVAR